MSGDIPDFLQYAFIEWCPLKAQRQLYLLLLPTEYQVRIDPIKSPLKIKTQSNSFQISQKRIFM